MKPFLTVVEQDGQDDIYILMGKNMHPAEVLAMVMIWDTRGEVSVERHPVEVPTTMMTFALLQMLGFERRCTLPFIECRVSYNDFELPRLVTWRPFQGMKIVVEIGVGACTAHNDPLDMRLLGKLR